MITTQELVNELEQESQTTRKFLARIPNDKYDWQPHPKSMTVRRLVTHIADLPTWVAMVLTTTELDFAKSPYKEDEINTTAELLENFEKKLSQGLSVLQTAKPEQLAERWVLRNGETILLDATKSDMIRITYCQIVHHRAQLGVFLRLLDVPIPGSYGPSADDLNF